MGRDTVWILGDFRAPKGQISFRREYDGGKDTSLAPSPPASSDEGTGAEAGMWEVVDDFVYELLGK